VAQRRGCALVLALIAVACLASFAALITIAVLVGREPSVSPRSTLVMRLSGDLTEGGPGDPITSLLPARRPPSVDAVVENLRKAKVDARIASVLLIPSGFATPYWAKLEEVRDAVLDFRRSGKPIYAHLEFGGQSEYYLATACDRIYLVPSSSLDLTGLASYEIFLRGTLDKIGAYPDMIHIGNYKTASNQLTEKTMTPAHREMAESLNTDAFEQMIRAIADGRKKSEADVRALVDKGPFLADDAKAAGLIDAVAYEDEVRDILKAGRKDAGQMDLADYMRISAQSLGLNKGARIAVIFASGAIVSGASGYDPLNGAAVGSDTLADSIRRVRKDARVRAIILRIDSPGGSAVASDVIWRELRLALTDNPGKPLVVSMSDLAASGGYYIAVAAPTIVAEPGTLTGSIGIYGGKIVLGGTYGKLGMTIESVSKGRNAELNSPIRPFNEEERAKIEQQLRAFYELFLKRVAESRHLTPTRVDEVGQGRVWTGRQAKEIGLVDELGGLQRAIVLAKQRAKIAPDAEVEIVAYPPRRTLYDFLTSQMGASTQVAQLLSLVGFIDPRVAWMAVSAGAATEAATAPLTLFRRGEVLALMPYVFTR
jgi:protease-4